MYSVGTFIDRRSRIFNIEIIRLKISGSQCVGNYLKKVIGAVTHFYNPQNVVLYYCASKGNSEFAIFIKKVSKIFFIFDLANLVCEILTEAFFQATFLGI